MASSSKKATINGFGRKLMVKLAPGFDGTVSESGLEIRDARGQVISTLNITQLHNNMDPTQQRNANIASGNEEGTPAVALVLSTPPVGTEVAVSADGAPALQFCGMKIVADSADGSPDDGSSSNSRSAEPDLPGHDANVTTDDVEDNKNATEE